MDSRRVLVIAVFAAVAVCALAQPTYPSTYPGGSGGVLPPPIYSPPPSSPGSTSPPSPSDGSRNITVPGLGNVTLPSLKGAATTSYAPAMLLIGGSYIAMLLQFLL